MKASILFISLLSNFAAGLPASSSEYQIGQTFSPHGKPGLKCNGYVLNRYRNFDVCTLGANKTLILSSRNEKKITALMDVSEFWGTVAIIDECAGPAAARVNVDIEELSSYKANRRVVGVLADLNKKAVRKAFLVDTAGDSITSIEKAKVKCPSSAFEKFYEDGT